MWIGDDKTGEPTRDAPTGDGFLGAEGEGWVREPRPYGGMAGVWAKGVIGATRFFEGLGMTCGRRGMGPRMREDNGWGPLGMDSRRRGNSGGGGRGVGLGGCACIWGWILLDSWGLLLGKGRIRMNWTGDGRRCFRK